VPAREHEQGKDHDGNDSTHELGQRITAVLTPGELLALARSPGSRDEVVGVLTRSVEEVVLDVSHHRVDSVLEGTLLGSLSSTADN
jgi:hypothetical protein